MDSLTVREYAAKERITIGTAYRRIWEGQVQATKVYGRWLISGSSGVCNLPYLTDSSQGDGLEPDSEMANDSDPE